MSSAGGSSTTRASGPDWILPSGEERGLARYLNVLWGGRWIVIVTVLAAVIGAGVYLSRAQKVYQAHSQLLFTPFSGTSATQGLPLISQSADPLRDVETAASFVNTLSVAQRVITTLHLRQTPQGLLRKISVAPIAESDIVDVAANANTPTAAAQLANAFVRQTINDRTSALDSQLDVLIPRLKAQIASLGRNNAAAGQLTGQLGQLESMRAGPSPNLSIAQTAVPPTGPSSPRKSLTVAAAIVGGLVVGVGVVLLIQLLRPRIRTEDELRERFRLPILARVPRMGAKSRWARRRSGPFAPDAVPAEAADAFRALRTVLMSPNEEADRGRIVLITGGSPLDGKSTTAINLSAALASTGERVILVEGDTRRPSIGAALNIQGHARGLVTMNADMPQLRMLLATGNGHAPNRSPSTWQQLLMAARSNADWVVVDAPPLIYAPDVLSAADLFDDVLMIVRLGNTDSRNLDETAEMLAHNGIRPTGLVLVGTSGHREYY